MQLASHGSSPTPLPWRYREAQAEAEELTLEVAAATGDNRLPVIEHAASVIFGYALRGLLEKQDAADMLQHATVQCGAIRDYGQDRVQAVLVAGETEAQREKRQEIGSGIRYQSRCLADVLSEKIKWLWLNRMGRGKVNIIAGPPGVGKSQLTVAMIAAVTTAGWWPDGTRAPLGSVVLVTCEDDAADTIVPRLKAAEADLSRVHILDWVVDPKSGERRHFDIGAHRDALNELICSIGDVVLVVIDPITAYCGTADSHKTADVRQALAPLQELAASTGTAIVAISHLNKAGGDGSAMSRVVGSGAFVAVARSAWLVADDPGDDTRKRRIMTPLKNNLGDDRTGFAFKVEGVTLPDGITTSRIAFEPGTVEIAASELLKSEPTSKEFGAQADAEAFLRDLLAGGPQMTRTVQEKAHAEGIADRTLDRARRALKVKAKKQGAVWVLALPKDDEERQERQGRQEFHA